MSAPTIRLASEADKDAIIALIHALNLYEAELSADRRTDFPAAEECYAAIRARIARDGGALVVACEDEAILGVLSLAFAIDEPFVQADLREYGVVTDLVVSQSHRNRGIGRMLLAEAERRTKERGLARLMIGVLSTNRAALASYEKSGFEPHMVTLSKALG
ncbi:MAG TPA: GNAT family N-acetyltransferase [Saliniramus sp.]|nr:GNAT family N-acetyltransferase [Saliniramus sp.]